MLPSLDNIIIGEVVKFTVAIVNSSNVAADPSALRLKLKSPTGIVTTYVFGIATELVKDSVGNYHADILITDAGSWTYRWESDTPNAGANEGYIVVKKSIVL